MFGTRGLDDLLGREDFFGNPYDVRSQAHHPYYVMGNESEPEEYFFGHPPPHKRPLHRPSSRAPPQHPQAPFASADPFGFVYEPYSDVRRTPYQRQPQHPHQQQPQHRADPRRAPYPQTQPYPSHPSQRSTPRYAPQGPSFDDWHRAYQDEGDDDSAEDIFEWVVDPSQQQRRTRGGRGRRGRGAPTPQPPKQQQQQQWQQQQRRMPPGSDSEASGSARSVPQSPSARRGAHPQDWSPQAQSQYQYQQQHPSGQQRQAQQQQQQQRRPAPVFADVPSQDAATADRGAGRAGGRFTIPVEGASPPRQEPMDVDRKVKGHQGHAEEAPRPKMPRRTLTPEQAATEIQKSYRAYKARRELHNLKELAKASKELRRLEAKVRELMATVDPALAASVTAHPKPSHPAEAAPPHPSGEGQQQQQQPDSEQELAAEAEAEPMEVASAEEGEVGPMAEEGAAKEEGGASPEVAMAVGEAPPEQQQQQEQQAREEGQEEGMDGEAPVQHEEEMHDDAAGDDVGGVLEGAEVAAMPVSEAAETEEVPAVLRDSGDNHGGFVVGPAAVQQPQQPQPADEEAGVKQEGGEAGDVAMGGDESPQDDAAAAAQQPSGKADSASTTSQLGRAPQLAEAESPEAPPAELQAQAPDTPPQQQAASATPPSQGVAGTGSGDADASQGGQPDPKTLKRSIAELSEKAMRVLESLDGVQSQTQGVRQLRKDLVRRAMALLEQVDSLKESLQQRA